ncbi:MAG: TRAP transporter small permease subunit [Rhizobiaceae bacterium]
MPAIEKLAANVSTVLARIGAWLVIVLIITMVYEVAARHFLNAPTIWAFEVGYMLSGSVFMLGIAFCQLHRAHIRVDFLYNRGSARKRAVIDIATYVCLVIPACGWLTYALIEYAYEAYVINEHSGASAWNPVVWPFRTVWAVGFGALVLQAISDTLSAIRRFRSNADEVSA